MKECMNGFSTEPSTEQVLSVWSSWLRGFLGSLSVAGTEGAEGGTQMHWACGSCLQVSMFKEPQLGGSLHILPGLTELCTGES